jgi:hypothetical protein
LIIKERDTQEAIDVACTAPSMRALLADESWLAGRSEYAFMAACGGRHLPYRRVLGRVWHPAGVQG